MEMLDVGRQGRRCSGALVVGELAAGLGSGGGGGGRVMRCVQGRSGVAVAAAAVEMVARQASRRSILCR